ncbi:MAG TPA: hypothetical protein IAD28_05205 [Candidatus Faeciplasma avium]|uniref:Uncharacterized protein n=1 Tax=Candidatus Faeciplasma avium TaxID=2840798 RepID=A0A9D1T4T9_9FIRM|nr:hypothetical protein [Candidatus Faeciplasma avium]
MKNFFSVIFVILALGSMVWPGIFIRNILKCIQAVIQQKKDEEFEKERTIAAISLFMMTVPPFIIGLLSKT